MTRSSDNSIFARNDFGLELPRRARVGRSTHGVSLVTVGRVPRGEVPVQIPGAQRGDGFGSRDCRNRRVGAALTISETRDERPTSFVAYLPHVVLGVLMTRRAWAACHELTGTPLGRALAVAGGRSARRPLGRSRL